MAIGHFSLYNSDLSNQVALGDSALFTLSGGSGANTALGSKALLLNNSGSNNTAGGYHALATVSSGSYNTAFGSGADVSSGTYSNATALGYGATVLASNTMVLGNASVTALRCNATLSTLSDIRFKKNITEETHGLDFVLQLKPIVYNVDVKKLNAFIYGDKADKLFKGSFWDNAINAKERILYSGFSAQQVEEAAQNSGYDFSGVVKPSGDHDTYGLSYSDFVVPLVKSVQELKKIIDDQQKIIQEQNQKFDQMQRQIDELKNNSTHLNQLFQSAQLFVRAHGDYSFCCVNKCIGRWIELVFALIGFYTQYGSAGFLPAV